MCVCISVCGRACVLACERNVRRLPQDSRPSRSALASSPRDRSGSQTSALSDRPAQPAGKSAQVRGVGGDASDGAYTHTQTHTHTHVCMYRYSYTYVCIYIYVYLYIYTCEHIYIYIYYHHHHHITHTQTHTHTHTHTSVWVPYGPLQDLRPCR
jgi:hypothetical protein